MASTSFVGFAVSPEALHIQRLYNNQTFHYAASVAVSFVVLPGFPSQSGLRECHPPPPKCSADSATFFSLLNQRRASSRRTIRMNCSRSAHALQVYEPVCGVDGTTYSNACSAGKVDVLCKGACPCPPVSPCCTTENPDCACGICTKLGPSEAVACSDDAPTSCCPTGGCSKVCCFGCETCRPSPRLYNNTWRPKDIPAQPCFCYRTAVTEGIQKRAEVRCIIRNNKCSV
jgi:hypothetical protein